MPAPTVHTQHYNSIDATLMFRSQGCTRGTLSRGGPWKAAAESVNADGSEEEVIAAPESKSSTVSKCRSVRSHCMRASSTCPAVLHCTSQAHAKE